MEHYLLSMNYEMTKLQDVIFESQDEFLLCKYHTCPSTVFRLHLQGKGRNIFSLRRVNYYFWLNLNVTFIIWTFFLKKIVSVGLVSPGKKLLEHEASHSPHPVPSFGMEAVL
jgi:hypothetical protein